MKKRFLVLFLFLIPRFYTLLGASGDVANFVNLGFSTNGRYFAFGQYGYSLSSSEAYGTIVTVDVVTNEFTQGSMVSEKQKYPLTPGDSGDGIFYQLIERYAAVRKRLGIDYTNRGRLLYLSSSLTEDARNSGLSDGGSLDSSITFRDFQTSTQYSVTMKQNINNMGPNVSSTLSLDLIVQNAQGVIQRYTVGHPKFVRTGVMGYEIESIILAPGGKGLVFIIARQYYAQAKVDVRYMVETIKF